MSNIVTTWFQCQEAAGKKPGDAARDLQKAVGMAVTVSRLREWEDARRGVPEKVYNQMLREVLPTCMGFLKQSGEGATAKEQAETLYSLLRHPAKPQMPNKKGPQ